ncbi:MAG TPA: hypothetical protein VKZ75_09115, partial [Cyclobacteriaceae bacterium]|nr:hypothetical protein [Cyclobacteriaceae bacterium]
MNQGRKEIIQIVFVSVAFIFLLKLFFIQVVDRSYADLADTNAIRKDVLYPVRGLILDRNGKLMVYNNPEYDLLIILKEVDYLDSARFCHVFDITQEQLRASFESLYTDIRNRRASELQPTAFIKQLSNRDFAKIQDHIDEFEGFYIQARTT